jgi:CheY-like chemotaxis protein
MSLNYKILWIDDNPRTIKSKKSQIEKFLKEEGLRPEITLIENGQGIDRYLDDPLLDLIVTDYYIHDQLDGKQLAERIRGLDKMIEIILYSQREGTDLYQEVGPLDGVYISNREGLEDKIKDVIKITIRRTQNVSNMRGIVISEAIDIENQIEDIILAYYDTREKDLAKELLSGDGCNELGPKIKFLKDEILSEMVEELNKDIRSGDNGKKSKAKEILRILEPLHTIAKKLNAEVCMPRNMLAHVEHVIDGGKICLRSLKGGYEDILIDSKKCKDIRQSLMKHAANLDQIKNFLPKWHEYKKKE